MRRIAFIAVLVISLAIPTLGIEHGGNEDIKKRVLDVVLRRMIEGQTTDAAAAQPAASEPADDSTATAQTPPTTQPPESAGG